MKRSLWAWGYEDRLPSGEKLEALKTRAELLTGARPEPRPPSPPRVRAARRPLPIELADFSTQCDEERARHTFGKGYRDLVRAHAGDFSLAPDAVVFPRTEAEVAQTLSLASREGWAVIPFGGGTSVVSGVEPEIGSTFSAVLSLDLRHLNQVLEVDPISRAARIQAGITGPELERALEPHGFTLRHFPQSFEFSTLGGWLATRAGGHFATLYTHIDELCEAVRMVTPSGVLETRRVPATGAGPEPKAWVLGSEGALGVITEAWMRVFPKPRFRLKADAFFPRQEAAFACARAISQAGLFPSNCRLLDAEEAFLNGVSGDGSTVLLLGFESADHWKDEAMARALALVTEHGGQGDGPIRRDESADREKGAGESWRDAFLDAPYLQSALVTLGVMADTFETACTWDRLERLYRRVKEEVGQALLEACGGGVVTCRFTHVYPDGPAPYFTFLGKARPGEELAQWQRVKDVAARVLLEEGATITHHHAVGRLHRPYWERERSDAFARALHATRQALDPAGVMNPGVLLGPP